MEPTSLVSQPLVHVAAMPITALVRRHADDAAFYWTQIDGSATSVLLRPEAVMAFQAQLDAHLEGLAVAGEAGLREALGNLERWRKPGEAFVAMLLGLREGGGRRTPALEKVLDVIRAYPDLLARGAISALAWVDPEIRGLWTGGALSGGDAVEVMIGLRAGALTRDVRAEPVERWARHPEAAVRAAYCRYGAAVNESLPMVLASDPDPVVGAEYALAGAWLAARAGRADQTALCAAQLWQAVRAQLTLWASLTGWPRVQAERRLRRWLRTLAWLAPLGHAGTRALVEQLPTRLALDLVLYHGDPAHLDLVVGHMGDETNARWAGWVWQSLTGVDLEAAVLTADEPEMDLDEPLTPARLDGDLGLPLPDAGKVAAHPANHGFDGSVRRVLLGREISAHGLREVLDPSAEHPQALRHVAARALAWMHPDYDLNLRAPLWAQAALLARMGVRSH